MYNSIDIVRNQKMEARYYYNKPCDYLEFKEKLSQILQEEFKKEFILF